MNKKKQDNTFIGSLKESGFFYIIADDYLTVESLKDSQDETDKIELQIAQAEINAYYEAYAAIYPEPQSFETAIEALKKVRF